MSDTAGSRNAGAVDQLLLEAGMDGDGQLRDALLDLRALAAETPAPSAELAALMAGSAEAATAVLPAVEPRPAADLPGTPLADELAARRKARRRTTLSVAASLAAGGAVAAASDQGFRDSFTQLNHAITTFVTGSGASPAGTTGGPAPAPKPAAPQPAATSSADAVPPASAPAPAPAAPAPAAAAPSSIPARAGNTPTHGGPQQKPAEVPAAPSLPTGVAEDVRKGLEQAPKLPVPVPTEVPLPGKAQDVPLK